MVRFDHLDLNLLRVFDVVMQERSLTRAAERLHVTQPAVSNAMRRLRDGLGEDLLVRTGHGVEPTARALELWPTVHESLSLLSDTIDPGRFDPSQSELAFRIGMIDATAARLLPQLARIQSAEAPSIQIQVSPLANRDPRALLEEGEIDVAVGYFPVVQADLTAHAQTASTVLFESRLLYQREYVCALRAGHPLARDAQDLSLEAYCAARHLAVSLSGRPYGFIDEALAALGLRRNVVMTVNQYYTAAQVAAQTDLLATLPRRFAVTGEWSSPLAIRSLPLPVAPVSVSMLWRRHNLHHAAIQWLLDAVQRSVLVSL